ncbi:MAG: response regulator [Phycisphaerales bacterium]
MNSTGSVVHLVDDDASFLSSMSRLLRAAGFAVRTYSSAREFLTDCPPATRGCAVCDLEMPGVNGLELQQALAARGDSMPVVFLTGHGSIPTSVCAMRQGADDFLTKRAPKADIIAAIERALAHDALLRSEQARLQALQAPFASLTPREREVLSHVLAGRLNKQIAAHLGVDERSVKRHRTSIMSKLRVGSVAELTHLVHDARLEFGEFHTASSRS